VPKEFLDLDTGAAKERVLNRGPLYKTKKLKDIVGIWVNSVHGKQMGFSAQKGAEF